MCLREAINEATTTWPFVMVDQNHFIDPGKTDGIHLADKIRDKCNFKLNQANLSQRDYEKIIELVSRIGPMRKKSIKHIYNNIINMHQFVEKIGNMVGSKEEVITDSLYLYYSYLLLKSMCRIYYGDNITKISTEYRMKILEYLKNYQGNSWVEVGIIMSRIYDKDCPRSDEWIPKEHPYWKNLPEKDI